MRPLNFFFYGTAFVIYVYKGLHLSEGPRTLVFFFQESLELGCFFFFFYTAGSGTQGSMPAREVSASVLVTFLLLWSNNTKIKKIKKNKQQQQKMTKVIYKRKHFIGLLVPESMMVREGMTLGNCTAHKCSRLDSQAGRGSTIGVATGF